MKIGFLSMSDHVDSLMVRETIPEKFKVLECSLNLGLILNKRKSIKEASKEDIYITNSNKETLLFPKKDLEEVVFSEVKALEKKVDLIVIGCTGGFQKFESMIPVLYPGKLLWGVVRAMNFKRISAFVPHGGGLEEVRKNWRFLIPEVSVFGVEPSSHEVPKNMGETPVVLDCMEYSMALKNKVQAYTKQPALLAREVVKTTLLSL